MPIQTLDQVKQEDCWKEVKACLARYGYNLNPKMTMSMQGMSFEIKLVPANAVVLPSGGGRSTVDA